MTKDKQKIYKPDDQALEGINKDTLDKVRAYVNFEPVCSSYLSEALKKSVAIETITKTFDSECKGKVSCALTLSPHNLEPNCLIEVSKRAYKSKYEDYWQTFNH